MAVDLPHVVFYLLGGLAVASSLLVVSSRNPVASLLYLVLSFFCLAGLFVTLQAHFLAAIQILVYAGAILVLFLFVIMLLNLGPPEGRRRLPRGPAVAVSLAAALGFVLLLGLVARGGDVAALTDAGVAARIEAEDRVSRSIQPVTEADAAVDRAGEEGTELERLDLDEVGVDREAIATQTSAGGRELVGSTEALGTSLFRDFLLPFEVTSLLLLVAMVGAVMIAKRER
ncbi:MAG: NADH-quinone oxidoreductase subunit J [Gemmatimonadota bacterium]